MEATGPQKVYSFDHVAINDKVTACDMKKVPLADEAQMLQYSHYR
jgi:Hypothetical methyltransferase